MSKRNVLITELSRIGESYLGASKGNQQRESNMYRVARKKSCSKSRLASSKCHLRRKAK